MMVQVLLPSLLRGRPGLSARARARRGKRSLIGGISMKLAVLKVSAKNFSPCFCYYYRPWAGVFRQAFIQDKLRIE